MTAQAGSISLDARIRRADGCAASCAPKRRALPAAATRTTRPHHHAQHPPACRSFARAQHVAVFLAFDGEPSLAPLIETRAAQRKRLYVPVLRGLTMTFAELERRRGAGGQLLRHHGTEARRANRRAPASTSC